MDVIILTIVGIIVASFIFNLIIDLIFGSSESSLDESDEAFLYLWFFTDFFDSHHDNND